MPRLRRAVKKKPSVSAIVRALQSTHVSRRPRRVVGRTSGRGFYKGFLGDVGAVAGAGLGLLGGKSMGGMTMGAMAGRTLGKTISGITGWGSYKLSHNVLAPGRPMVKNRKSSGNSTTVRHTEYIGDVLSSTAFSVQYDLPIQPGLNGSFPWLSGLASSFQQYELEGVIYRFVPTSGNAISGDNPALGSVMGAVAYDSLQPIFTNKSEILNQDWASEAMPCNPAMWPVECARNQTTIDVNYIRSGAVPSGADVRLYDQGRLLIATQGNPSTGNVLGSLYCDYQISFLKPQLAPPVFPVIPVGSTLASGCWLFETGISNVNPFGTDYSPVDPTTAGLNITSNTVSIDANTFLPGLFGGQSTFLFNYNITNNVSGDYNQSGYPTLSAFVNCGLVGQGIAPEQQPYEQISAHPTTGAGVNNYLFNYMLYVNDPTLPASFSAVITFVGPDNGHTGSPLNSSGSVYIQEIQSELVIAEP